MLNRFAFSFLIICSSIQVHANVQAPIREGWSSVEMAQAYHHNSLLQFEWSWEGLFKNYSFRGDESVFDYGSGDGKISALMARLAHNGRVHGVDIAAGMVEFAQLQFPVLNYPNLSFSQIKPDFSEFANYKNSMDLITSFCVFHLVNEPFQVMRKFNAMLKMRGHLVLVYPVYDPDKLDHFATALRATFQKYKLTLSKRSEENLRIRKDTAFLREKIEGLGFKVHHLAVVDTHDFFPSREEYLAWLEGTLPGNENMPKDKRHQVAVDFVEKLIELDPSVQTNRGWFHKKGQRIDLYAEKIKDL